MSKRTSLVCQHLENISREALEKYQDIIHLKPGFKPDFNKKCEVNYGKNPGRQRYPQINW
jgi:hypothetical protein